MKIILLAVLSFAFLPTFAQFYDFDISNYRLPEMKRQSLDFSFNSKARSGVWKFLSNDSVPNEYRDKNNFSNNHSNIVYSLYLNSPKTQTNLTFGLNGEFNKETEVYKHSGQAEEKYHEKELTAIVNLYFDKKQFNKKNWFLMAESNSSLFYGSYRSDRMNREEVIPSGNIELGIGGGKGRIEQVQDFRQAILMLNELEKRGVLNRGVTEQEMYELAALFSELKNERFFDARIRKEADLEAIDSLLTAKGLVEGKSISYYYGMEDLWTYGDLQIRESGNQLLFLGIPSYSFHNSKIDSISSKTNTFSMMYMLEFESKKPISMKWQRNFNIGMLHQYINVLESPQNENVQKAYHTQVYMKGDLGFYPNTRTFLMGQLNVNYNNSSFNEFGEDIQNSFYTTAILGCYYYISPRVRLNFSGSLNYRTIRNPNEDNSSTTNFYVLYNAAFSYALF